MSKKHHGEPHVNAYVADLLGRAEEEAERREWLREKFGEPDSGRGAAGAAYLERYATDPEAFESLKEYQARVEAGETRVSVELDPKPYYVEHSAHSLIEFSNRQRPNEGQTIEAADDDDETPPKWREFDRWAAEHLTRTELDHVRALYSGKVENDALGALHGCHPGEHSRARVNRLNSAIRKKLTDGYNIKSDGTKGSVGHTQLFGP